MALVEMGSCELGEGAELLRYSSHTDHHQEYLALAMEPGVRVP